MSRTGGRSCLELNCVRTWHPRRRQCPHTLARRKGNAHMPCQSKAIQSQELSYAGSYRERKKHPLTGRHVPWPCPFRPGVAIVSLLPHSPPAPQLPPVSSPARLFLSPDGFSRDLRLRVPDKRPGGASATSTASPALLPRCRRPGARRGGDR
jgi:hypothetical protein